MKYYLWVPLTIHHPSLPTYLPVHHPPNRLSSRVLNLSCTQISSPSPLLSTHPLIVSIPLAPPPIGVPADEAYSPDLTTLAAQVNEQASAEGYEARRQTQGLTSP